MSRIEVRYHSPSGEYYIVLPAGRRIWVRPWEAGLPRPHWTQLAPVIGWDGHWYVTDKRLEKLVLKAAEMNH